MNSLSLALPLAALLAAPAHAQPAPSATDGSPFPVIITVDAAKTLGDLKPIWRFFGYDEANYTYMKDGKKLLSELGALDGLPIYIRCHHLLTSGDGAQALKFGSTSAYKEDANGKPIYDWSINDKIFDTYRERGLMPYVEIGFMPEALTTHPQDYPRHPSQTKPTPVTGGQSYPPKDYAKWGELVYQWAQHCAQRYGTNEAAQWYWEVWNEPNISYWHGSPEEYFKLYDYAVAGVRRALPSARVGGPETAGGTGGKFLGAFLQHCAHGTNYVTGQAGSPLDFISFHTKGAPEFTNGHVRMAMGHQLKATGEAFALIASFPEFKQLPIVIGEFDPEGGAAYRKPTAVYRTGTMYSSYTAAIFPRALDLAEKEGVNLEGALTWAFEFEDQPLFANFRVLASRGIDLPVLNVFRMFSQMSGQRIAVQSTGAIALDEQLAGVGRERPDVSALASLGDHQLAVMLWHYEEEDVPGSPASVTLNLQRLPLASGSVRVRQYRIDAQHSNAFAAWQRMGAPAEPTASQYEKLQNAGQLGEFTGGPSSLRVENRGGTITLNLPRQAVSLIVLQWQND